MTCPKCHAKMRQFERNGVTIDQCSECRGIFLDRGELEHLIDADAQFNSQQAPPPPASAPRPPTAPPAPAAPGHYPPPPSPYGHGGQPHYRHGRGGAHYRHGHGGGYGGHGGHGHKRRKSFFENLFD